MLKATADTLHLVIHICHVRDNIHAHMHMKFVYVMHPSHIPRLISVVSSRMTMAANFAHTFTVHQRGNKPPAARHSFFPTYSKWNVNFACLCLFRRLVIWEILQYPARKSRVYLLQSRAFSMLFSSEDSAYGYLLTTVPCVNKEIWWKRKQSLYKQCYLWFVICFKKKKK